MISRWLPVLLAGALLTPLLPRDGLAQIVVVVNPSNPVKNVTLEELRRLYLGRTTTFSRNLPVSLMEQAVVSDAFYEAALGMNEARVRRHWIGIVFSGETAKPPRSFAAADDLKRAVAENPGAIAFIDLAETDPGMKVLTINGRHPDDDRYPLRPGRSE
jgi:ABC-type phosphate transport system substrate-binding protein